MKIIRASEDNIAQVSHLFDLYRQFYKCDSDMDLAQKFISDRILRNESIIFLATNQASTAMGFVQLYPSFCSVDAVKILILYDLYVDANYRKYGVGKTLMNRATDHARETGIARLDLLTAHSNKPGQALYENLGYKRVLEDFYAYSLQISDR
jgi:ribosomal protein S18 acetylase RimI-like enzyme